MSNEAMSQNAAIGLGFESGFGNEGSINEWLQAIQASLTNNQKQDVLIPIVGDSEVQDTVGGLVEAGGGLDVPAYGGSGFGALLKLATRSSSSEALTFKHAAAPTVTPASGGTVPDGAYYVKTCPVVAHTATGLKFMTNWSAESLAATAGTGNNTLGVTWVNPSSSNLLPGFTHAGTLIAITAADGASNSEKILHFVSGTGTSYSITSIAALSSVATTTAVYAHSFLPGTSQPPSATIEIINDNGAAKQYLGCINNNMNLSIKPNERVKATFDLFSQRMLKKASPSTPSYSLVKAFHGKNTTVYIQGQAGTLTQNNLCNSFTLQLGNKAVRRYNFTGNDYARTIRAQSRDIKGGFEFDFESTAQQDHMLAGDPMDVRLYVFGEPTTPTGTFTESATTIYPWPYMLEIHIPNFKFEDHDANPNTDNPITEKLGFVARKDATAAYALRLRLFNTASSV